MGQKQVCSKVIGRSYDKEYFGTIAIGGQEDLGEI